MQERQRSWSMVQAWTSCRVQANTHALTGVGNNSIYCNGCKFWVHKKLPVLTSRHLSYKTLGHVYSSCMQSTMLHASETWPLTKTNLQRNVRTMIRQICSIKPVDVPQYSQGSYWQSLRLRTSTSFWEREGFAGLGMCKILVVQSEQYVIYRLMAGGGQGGPSYHGRNWLRKTAMSGSLRHLTLKKGAPGDQVWDLLCVQLASYLEEGPLMWMMPLHLYVNQKSDYDDDTVQIPFSSFITSWKQCRSRRSQLIRIHTVLHHISKEIKYGVNNP